MNYTTSLYSIAVAACAFILAPQAMAQHQSGSGPNDWNKILPQSLAPMGASPGTTSPFEPPEEKLGTYVVNTGPYLDTSCTYRGGGPLRIELAVPAVVNDEEIGADGKLKNPNKLIMNRVIGANIYLRFPVYDIDSGAVTYGYAPEINKLYFNGKYVKTLKGINNIWTEESCIVSVTDLKFVSKNSPNAKNEIRVDIDTGNPGNEYWCMAIDWVALEFECAAPYVLAHGIDSDAGTWDEQKSPGVLSTLTEKGVRFGRFSVARHGRSLDNAVALNTHITGFLAPLKAEKVHIIAHSKGGLDAQVLQALEPEFKILSLSTISTPHLGAVAADLSIIQQTVANERVNAGADPHGFAKDYVETWTWGFGPRLPGLLDLATEEATAAILGGLRGNISPTFTYGATADLNADNELQSNESAGLFPTGFHYAAERAWRVMRDFSSATIVSTVEVPGQLWGTRTVLTYQTVENHSAQANDIVVTLRSANPSYGTPRGNYLANHSTVKNGTLIERILADTIGLK